MKSKKSTEAPDDPSRKIPGPRSHASDIIFPERDSSNSHEKSDSNGDTVPSAIEQQINKVKNKVKMLNPLRRARSQFTGHDGSNNPNIQGEDN